MAKAGISIADIAAGVTAYHSILAALIQRGRTGPGDHIEVSMLEAMAEWMGFPMYFAFDGAEPPPRNGAGHATIYPYGPYATADGGVFFGLQNDREWAAFADHGARTPDSPPTRASRAMPAAPTIATCWSRSLPACSSALPTEEAMARLEQAGIATARASTTWRRCGSIRS